jgi:hypothetical protein
MSLFSFLHSQLLKFLSYTSFLSLLFYYYSHPYFSLLIKLVLSYHSYSSFPSSSTSFYVTFYIYLLTSSLVFIFPYLLLFLSFDFLFPLSLHPLLSSPTSYLYTATSSPYMHCLLGRLNWMKEAGCYSSVGLVQGPVRSGLTLVKLCQNMHSF